VACKGFDEQVVRHDKELERLEKEFVCVRLVQMKGVDLQVFQFDYDQTWAAFFMNADGTIYGRYGTRAGHKDHATTHISLASLKKSMQRALELHRGYPANRAQLAGKLGPAVEFRDAEHTPGAPLKERHCIHCHNVWEDVRQVKYREKRLSTADLWVYPLPENLGLRMEVDDGLPVKAVSPQSPAARAGLRAGDECVLLNGQRLISQADIQWVLHNAPTNARLSLTFKRGTRRLQRLLALGEPWKETDLSWRETAWALRPGIWSVPLSSAEKQHQGLAPDALALRLKWTFGKSELAKQSGLREGDVIVAVDGRSATLSESQFLVYVRTTHSPGDKVRLTVLRGRERQDLWLPVE
jgi:hypothetical protein